MQPNDPGSHTLWPLPMSVRFSCDHFEDVMTSWALGPHDKAAVWTTFLLEFEPEVVHYEVVAHARGGPGIELHGAREKKPK